MKNKLSFAQTAYFYNGNSGKDISMMDNVLVINRETIVHDTIVEDLEGLDLEFGAVVFDIPNITSYIEVVKETMKKLKSHSKAGEFTNFFVVNKPQHYYTDYELKGYKLLDKIINKNFGSYDAPNFLKFPEILRELDQSVLIEEWHFHKLENIEKSSKIISSVLNEVRKQKLSPYERYLAAYDFVTSLSYNMFGNFNAVDKDGNIIERYVSDNYVSGGRERDWRMSRTITNVLTTGHIVCVGYAELLELFCRELEIPAISERVESLKQDGTRNVYHMRNIVRIRDKKYGINGIYKSDPTVDSYKEGDGLDAKRFTAHLIPVKERFLKEVSVYESLAQNKLSLRDTFVNTANSREALTEINNSGIVKEFREIKTIRRLLDDFYRELGDDISNKLSGDIRTRVSDGTISFSLEDNVNLSDLELAKLEEKTANLNQNVLNNVAKKTAVFKQFLIDCNQTKHITEEQFKKAFNKTIMLTKPGFSDDKHIAISYTDWIHDFNKQMSLITKRHVPAFVGGDTVSKDNNNESESKAEESANTNRVL